MKYFEKAFKKIKLLAIVAMLLLMPALTFAATPINPSALQAGGNNGGFYGVVSVVKNAINVILPVIISLAVLYFLWGLFLYIKSDDAAKQAEARMYILWSVIFIAVMVSVWGLVNILTSTFNLDKTAPTPPPIPEYSS